MVKRRKMILLFLPLLLLCGCAAPLVYLDPIADSDKMEILTTETGKYIQYKDSSFEVDAAIYTYEKFFVVDLTLSNKTDVDISENEYFIWLFDGRDYKSLGRYDKETIEKIGDIYLESANAAIPDPQYEYKYYGSNYNYYGDYFGSSYQSGTLRKEETAGSSGARLGAAISSAFKKAEVNQALDRVVQKYFSFRTLYANESRSGYLCFRADFDLELPLTLGIVMRGHPIHLKFKPRSE